MVTLAELPPELLANLVRRFRDARTFGALSRVCRALREAALAHVEEIDAGTACVSGRLLARLFGGRRALPVLSATVIAEDEAALAFAAHFPYRKLVIVEDFASLHSTASIVASCGTAWVAWGAAHPEARFACYMPGLHNARFMMREGHARHDPFFATGADVRPARGWLVTADAEAVPLDGCKSLFLYGTKLSEGASLVSGLNPLLRALEGNTPLCDSVRQLRGALARDSWVALEMLMQELPLLEVIETPVMTAHWSMVRARFPALREVGVYLKYADKVLEYAPHLNIHIHAKPDLLAYARSLYKDEPRVLSILPWE